jgi:hypothetical protein
MVIFQIFLFLAGLFLIKVNCQMTMASNSITMSSSRNDVQPPINGQFFYLDLDRATLDGYYSIKLWKTDSTDVYNVHVSTGSFYTALYQRNCYTCNSPSKY